MNSKEYVENVLVTEARDFTVVKERITDTQILRLVHASVGIASEISELFNASDKLTLDKVLDRTNVMEECGDILWYIGIAASALNAVEGIMDLPEGMRLSTHKNDYPDEVVATLLSGSGQALSVLSGDLQDLLVKKHVFYGKPLNVEAVTTKLRLIHNTVIAVLQTVDFTVEQARERNIAKLKARYGSKFTEAAAQKRDLDTERKILEGNMSVSDKEALEALDECLDDNVGDR